MKQKNYILNLIKYAGEPNPYGTTKGRKAHANLVDDIAKLIGASEVGISLANIQSADVSFFRESVIYSVKRYSREIAFYICDVSDEDLISNLHGAALSGEQPLTCWKGEQCRFLGPETSASNKTLLDFIVKKHKTTTAEAAAGLDISVQNASTRLKRLAEEGFLLRSEESAESGGKEFIYKIIGISA
ncbi:hypothetical protein ABR39_09595 [Enterobacter genomosp. O]|uniref:MarR family transcriptional regulator n=1 Tax=Enterobacter genomosp. O TaxID=2364150 RepID=UPI000643A727|nr:MarR family transcriptional regulator [Enterobacter genomosp. O]KLP56448.1 hypothetical protein ABR39_09595 [Enterobacter genomosp. O]